MKLLRRVLPFIVILVLMLVVWVWWNRPKRVDMAAYVPADSLIYMEANSLPDIADGISRTDAWQALAAPAGIGTDFGKVGWLSRVASWTGIGPADAIIFSRMQVSVVVLGVAAADGGETLNVKPRIAIVVETHSTANRTSSSIEKHVGNFARRAYGNPSIDKRDLDGAHWIIWSSETGERRIIAAMTGSLAVIGNDESAVRGCLSVRRGERPSLAANLELAEARRRLADSRSLAFGFVSSQGSAKLAELAAAFYVGQLSDDAQTQSLAANIIPQVAKKILGSIGWSARYSNGGMEDTYVVSVTNDAGARLRSSFDSASVSNLAAGALLPSDLYSLTRYGTRDPLTAWRSLSLSVSSQLDPVLAVMVPPFLKATLGAYGIEDPEQFLRAVGPEIVTARIGTDGRSTVLVAKVEDERMLREIVSRRLGPSKPEVERVGDTDLLASTDEKRGAASFVNGYLLMGSKQAMRRCLTSLELNQTLSISPSFQASLKIATQIGPAHITTFTRDSLAARDFIVFIANQRTAASKAINIQGIDEAINQLPYAVSKTEFVDGGIERRTRSSFGLLGFLAMQFETRKQPETSERR